MADERKKEAPQILGAADLVHLNQDQRLGLLGHDAWRERREFLQQLLGAAAIISLPLLEVACKSGEQAPADAGCPSHSPGDGPCASQAQDGPVGDAAQPKPDRSLADSKPGPDRASPDLKPKPDTTRPDVTKPDVAKPKPDMSLLPPQIASTVPSNYGVFTIGQTKVTINFTRPMDQASVQAAISVSIGGTGTFCKVPVISGLQWVAPSSVIVSASWGSSISCSFTKVTIAGSAKDTTGKFLDGNKDGVSNGTDGYSFQFTQKLPTCTTNCSCQSDCGSNFCPCETYSQCPFDNPCATYGCVCEVQCSCQLYNV